MINLQIDYSFQPFNYFFWFFSQFALNTTWITSYFNCKYFSMCVHTSHRPYGYPPLTLHSWWQTHRNPWCSLWHLCWHYMKYYLPRGMRITTCASFNHVQLLLSMTWHRWYSHSSRRCHCRHNASRFISSILCNPRICSLRFDSKQRNELLRSTPYWSIFPFGKWGIWMSTQTGWCVFTWLCQCHLELESVRRPSSFCLGYFFLSKNFNHIAKDASISHHKLGSSYRPSYFSTCTPSRHTFHHHCRPIVDSRFLTWNFFDT